MSGGSRRLWRGVRRRCQFLTSVRGFFFSAQRKKSSGAGLDPEGLNVEVGDQVLVAGQKNGIVRFYGKTDFAPGASAALGREVLKSLVQNLPSSSVSAILFLPEH